MINNLQDNWATAKLGAVCKTTSGGTPSRKREDYFQGDIPWVKSGELPDGPVVEIEEYITQEAVKNSSAKLFPSGSLLIAMYGATVGKLGILNHDATTNQAVCAIFPTEVLDTKYLFWYLRYVRSDLIAQAIGGAQPNISQGILRELEIPIAPLAQQKRIVAEIEKQFSRLDEAVANLKRVKANLKRYKAAVLKAAVEGKLTEEWRKQHPDVEPASKLLERIKTERKERHKAQLSEWTEVVKSWELGGRKGKKPAKPRKPIDLPTLSADGLGRLSALPPKWAWVKLGNCNVDVFDGPFGSNLKSSDYVENGVRVIRLENIGELEFIDEKKTYISESKYDGLKKHTVSFGDIIFSSFIAGCTRVVSLPKQIECAINKADCFCVRVHGETLLTRFLEMFLGTRNTYEQFSMEIHGATRPRINTTQLKECAIPLCSIAEQDAIVMEVDRRISLLTEMETEVDANFIRAENLRQSILHKAFSGRLLGWPNTGKTNNHKREVTYA